MMDMVLPLFYFIDGLAGILFDKICILITNKVAFLWFVFVFPMDDIVAYRNFVLLVFFGI